MLPKKERLDRKAFSRFFSVGKRFHSPTFTLIYTPDNVLRASAVAPKKVLKTAVFRNKFRRRVYDVYERLRKEASITGVFIVIAKEPASTMPYALLREELTALIRKTGAIR